MTRSFTIGLLHLISIGLISCSGNRVYDDYVDLNQGIWHVDSLTAFQFEIPSDTSEYTLSYNVRYAAGYPYYNLYITYYLEDSVGETISSELQEIILFDKKTGKPLGDGLGDIFDREVLIFSGLKFPYHGEYTYKVKQFMRTEELAGIMSFGLKIEVKEGDN